MLCGIVAPVVACTVPNPDFCNETDRQTCEVGYSCDLSLNRCIPTPDAAARDATASDATTSDAVAPDAEAPDASLLAWDIAYVNELTTSDEYDLSFLARVVNTGPVPFDLSGLEVTSVEHDGPAGVTFDVRLATSPLIVSVPAGTAVGKVTEEPMFAALITEPVADDTVDLLRFVTTGLSSGDPPLHATIVLRGGGLAAPLNVTTNVGFGFTSFNSVVRVSAIAP
jgi:hypothetical protein